MKKLERDSLLADRQAVLNILQSLPDEDPIGKLSFEARLQDIDEQLRRLEDEPDQLGSVALLFAGAPVIGSRSIEAGFSTKIISTFQDLVTKRVAAEEFGELGSRGRLPVRSPTKLAIREIVRGSVGFVLEEQSSNLEITDTAIKQAIDDVTQVITGTAASEHDKFEKVVEDVDPRLLVSLRDFFVTLDDFGATVRIIEQQTDAVLDQRAIRRARQRIDLTEIQQKESDDVKVQLLGLFPERRSFEMRLLDTGEVIHGSVAARYAEEYMRLIESQEEGLVGKKWRAKMRIREIHERNKPSRKLYRLLGLIERLPDT
jgi:hypothetical protein